MDIEYLKKVKKAKKMTLQEISDLSGIPKRTVDGIFSGKTKNPRIDTMQAIERALGIEEEKSPPSNLTEGENALIELYRTASEEQKAMFLQLLRLTLLKK